MIILDLKRNDAHDWQRHTHAINPIDLQKKKNCSNMSEINRTATNEQVGSG